MTEEIASLTKLPEGASVDGDKPNGPRSRKGAETRARILDAAKQIFEENGFLESRISDIAERAGLSHGSFYHYFESKEDVFREVAEAADEKLSSPIWQVILDESSDASPSERIREAVRRFLEIYRQEARIIGVVEQVSRYDPHVAESRRKHFLRYRNEVAASIRRLQEHGLADPTLDPMIASAVLGSITSRFPEAWLVQGLVDCSFEDAVEHVAKVYINGLRLKG